jgi:hypothetical protein
MKTACLAGFLVFVLASAAMAQPRSYHHASTAEQGILDGMASLTVAQSRAIYLRSLAAINLQKARELHIENNKKAVDAYFYMREANQSARKPVRLNTEQLTAVAKNAAPTPLRPHDYDSTSGRLRWPIIFLTDEYIVERNTIEQLFLKRLRHEAGVGSGIYADVKRLSLAMQHKLGEHVSEVDPAQYIDAKNFLLGVTAEAVQPTVTHSLTVR